MKLYAIGERYPEFSMPGTTGACMDFDDKNLMTILISDANPTSQTIALFRQAKHFMLGLHYYREQILLALKAGTFTWMDMIYRPHAACVLSKEAFMQYQVDGALGINIYYVNSNTGELLGMQLISSTIQFHEALIAAIQDKLSRPYNSQTDQRVLEEVYRELPDPLAIAKAAEVGFKLSDEGQGP